MDDLPGAVLARIFELLGWPLEARGVSRAWHETFDKTAPTACKRAGASSRRRYGVSLDSGAESDTACAWMGVRVGRGCTLPATCAAWRRVHTFCVGARDATDAHIAALAAADDGAGWDRPVEQPVGGATGWPPAPPAGLRPCRLGRAPTVVHVMKLDHGSLGVHALAALDAHTLVFSADAAQVARDICADARASAALARVTTLVISGLLASDSDTVRVLLERARCTRRLVVHADRYTREHDETLDVLAGAVGGALRDLHVHAAFWLRNIAALYALGLQRVVLEHAGTLRNLDALAGVREVTLRACNVEDARALAGARVLDLSLCKNLVDVSALGSVDVLTLNDCEHLEDVGALGNVRELRLRGCTRVRNVLRLGGARQELLDLEGCVLVEDVSTLGSVRELSLRGCALVRNVTRLGRARQRRLCLAQCPLVANVSMLGRLDFLSLENCVRVGNVSALGSVRVLNLEGCVRVNDVSALCGVQRLNLTGCAAVRDLRALSKGTLRIALVYSVADADSLAPAEPASALFGAEADARATHASLDCAMRDLKCTDSYRRAYAAGYERRVGQRFAARAHNNEGSEAETDSEYNSPYNSDEGDY